MSTRDLLADLLNRLKAVNNTLLIGGDEVKDWPNHVLAIFLEYKLIAVASPAKSLVCDGCEEACSMPVETIPGSRPRAFILCDKRDDIGRIPVDLDSLKQWRMTRAAVTRILMNAADGYPVTEQMVRENFAVLSLHKILTVEHGQLRVDFDRLLDHLLPDIKKPIPNRFILTGDHWSITYQGQTRTFNNTLGLRYIAWLIRNQGKDILVSDLYYAVNPPDSEDTDSTLSSMTAEQFEEMGLSLGDLGGADYVLTPEGKKCLEQAISRIQDQIDEAIEFGDEAKQAELEEELDKILSYLTAKTGLGGKTRRASSAIEKVRSSVTQRIKSDINNKIKPTLPDFGHHLDTLLKTGTHCAYKPHPSVDWIFDAD